jgi:hypothetical protein
MSAVKKAAKAAISSPSSVFRYAHELLNGKAVGPDSHRDIRLRGRPSRTKGGVHSNSRCGEGLHGAAGGIRSQRATLARCQCRRGH